MAIPGTFHAGLVLDGYRLIRPIGAGGFGTVWLAEGESTGDFHAVKIVDASANALERELAAVRRFREFSRQMRSPHLIAIEHVNTHGSALFYVLPLADGGPSHKPINPDWIPDTLAARIEARKTAQTWFSSREILDAFLPISRVVAEMNAGGVVHRDIKPANILFVGGRPCLADIGLLGDDRPSLTARGTPGHLPPSWYLEASGQPDMWGLATTLYTLLTGNHPDKIGRANFRWPPQGEASMALEERQTWERWHAAILRATEESPHERFLTIHAFADACQAPMEGEKGQSEGIWSPQRHSMIIALIALLIMVAMALALVWGVRSDKVVSGKSPEIRAGNGFSLPESPQSPAEKPGVARTPIPQVDLSGVFTAIQEATETVKKAANSEDASQGDGPDAANN
jgi:serine/threonine protein kinase